MITADPKTVEAAPCVADSFAVFVNPILGLDSDDGSKAKPVKTIGKALTLAAGTGKRRIYACNGAPFEESVKVTTPTSLFGGFSCGAWVYEGIRTKLTPAAEGFALRIDGVAGALTVADMEITAKNASAPGASSMAVFVSASDVTFLRAKLVAGAGKDGTDGIGGITGQLVAASRGGSTLPQPRSPDGYGPTGDDNSKICACRDSAGSTGGRGGLPPYGTGGLGLPALGGGLPGPPVSPGNPGLPGAPGVPANAISKLGAFIGDRWIAAVGLNGSTFGSPGQGGGGGGAGAQATEGGGGGGCGGCAGGPGRAGVGGGASVAVAIRGGQVALKDCLLVTGAGGVGGAGGRGGSGIPGGNPGSGAPASGGLGGLGGDGSPASGSAGGIVAGVLHDGLPAPTIDQATTNIAVLGSPGAGGKGGLATAGKDGPNGKAAVVLDASQL